MVYSTNKYFKNALKMTVKIKWENIFSVYALEVDLVLSTILSKALLLADDDKITDVTITQQIK